MESGTIDAPSTSTPRPRSFRRHQQPRTHPRVTECRDGDRAGRRLHQRTDVARRRVGKGRGGADHGDGRPAALALLVPLGAGARRDPHAVQLVARDARAEALRAPARSCTSPRLGSASGLGHRGSRRPTGTTSPAGTTTCRASPSALPAGRRAVLVVSDDELWSAVGGRRAVRARRRTARGGCRHRHRTANHIHPPRPRHDQPRRPCLPPGGPVMRDRAPVPKSPWVVQAAAASVAHQRHEPGHVAPGEGVDETVEVAPLLAVDRSRRGEGAGSERRPRSLQGAVDGRHTGVEQRGDLIGLPAEDVVQDHDHALRWRETPERDDEGEADVVAPFGELGGAVPRRRDTCRRSASTPARDRRRRRGGAGGAARRSRRWWRCGTATCAGCSGPRTGHEHATRASSSPGRRRRPPRTSRASGDSGGPTPPDAARARRHRRARHGSPARSSSRSRSLIAPVVGLSDR